MGVHKCIRPTQSVENQYQPHLEMLGIYDLKLLTVAGDDQIVVIYGGTVNIPIRCLSPYVIH